MELQCNFKDNTVKNNQMSETLNLMTVRESANYLNVSNSLIRKWISNRDIIHIRLGGKIMLRKQTLIDLVNKCEVGT